MYRRSGVGFDPAADLQDAITTAQSRLSLAGMFMAGMLAFVGFAVLKSSRKR